VLAGGGSASADVVGSLSPAPGGDCAGGSFAIVDVGITIGVVVGSTVPGLGVDAGEAAGWTAVVTGGPALSVGSAVGLKAANPFPFVRAYGGS
jgi:hypothetical protein